MSFVHKIIDDIKNSRRRQSLERAIQKMDGETAAVGKMFNVQPLTADEKKAKDSFWGKFTDLVPGDAYFELQKAVHGFDPKYIPDSLFYTQILYGLNDRREAHLLEDKNLYGFYYDDLNRPYEVARNVRGIYYSAENQVITEEEAINAILRYGKKLIVKPTCDSEQGRGVRLIKDYNRAEIESTIAQYKQNFVFQEAIEQCDEISVFNPTSLNTIRVHTLFLNGKFSILKAGLRCGSKDAIIDNAGAGGMMVGIHPEDGTLFDYGINKKGKIFKESHTGVKLEGYQLHDFDKVKSFVETLHKRVPFIRYVGWDIAVRKDGTPTFIEMNASSPGIFVIQMCTGPIFGDRLEEVLSFVKSRIK